MRELEFQESKSFWFWLGSSTLETVLETPLFYLNRAQHTLLLRTWSVNVGFKCDNVVLKKNIGISFIRKKHNSLKTKQKRSKSIGKLFGLINSYSSDPLIWKLHF